MTTTIDDVEITSIANDPSTEMIEIRGTWSATVLPEPAPPGHRIPSYDRYPPFDKIEWGLGQTVVIASKVQFRPHASGPVEARARPSDPWRLMEGTTHPDARTAADEVPDHFIDEGEFRFSVPHDALSAPPQPGVVISAPLMLRLNFAYRVQIGRRNPRYFHGYTIPHTQAFTPDITRPHVAIWSPGPGAERSSPVTFTGSVTDAGTSAGIRLAGFGVRDTETDRWFDFSSSSWVNQERFRQLDLDHNSPSAATFSTSWREVGGSQHYRAVVRAEDEHGNERRAERPFFVDRLRPKVSRSMPRLVVGDTMPIGLIVEDDGTIASVRLSILDIDTEQFWNDGTGSWQDTRVDFTVPFTSTTDGAVIRYAFSPSVGSGHYRVGVEVYDKADNRGRSGVRFRLVPADTEPPDAVIFFPPTDDQNLVPGLITFWGRATDNVAPRSVLLRIRDRDTDLDWNGSAWQAANASLLADTDPIPEPAPNGVSVNWSYDFDAVAAATFGGSGNYRIVAYSFDEAGNEDVERAGRNFTVG
ncbi:MAG: hypothetical protein AAF467_06570 [Actinomycetota bacterium]